MQGHPATNERKAGTQTQPADCQHGTLLHPVLRLLHEQLPLPIHQGTWSPVTACLGSWAGAPSAADRRDPTYLCSPLGTFSAPWAALARSHEQYCLAWEAKYLMELGNALETILSGLANMVAQEALKYTVLSGKHPSTPPHCQLHAHCTDLRLPVSRALCRALGIQRSRGCTPVCEVCGLCGEGTGQQPTTSSHSVSGSYCRITSNPKTR